MKSHSVKSYARRMGAGIIGATVIGAGIAYALGMAAQADGTTDIQVPPAGYDVGMIQNPHMFKPKGKPNGVVFLISDANGWNAMDEAEANRLQGNGNAVVGLDLPAYLTQLEKHPDDDDCAYAISDIEELSKRLQTGFSGDYQLPIIAGHGAGGGLALSLATQIPASTIGAIVAIDPTAGIPNTLKAPLCTDAKYRSDGTQTIYDYSDGDMNVPVNVVFTVDAPQDGVNRVNEQEKAFPLVTSAKSDASEAAALSDALDHRLKKQAKHEGPLNLPITELPVDKPAFDTLAIIYSGDGGWRDIDMQVGQNLQASGIPTVGVDSLRYFWNERKPQETADDLSKIIDHYKTEWGVSKVILIGYSFGADILPNSYNLMPSSDQKSVVQMTLMGLSHDRDYVIHVTGWLGMSSGSANDPAKDLQKVPAGIVQCLYGKGDDDDACHDLTGKGYELIELEGGHHFDGDYETLTKHIVDGLKSRS